MEVLGKFKKESELRYGVETFLRSRGQAIAGISPFNPRRTSDFKMRRAYSMGYLGRLAVVFPGSRDNASTFQIGGKVVEVMVND